MTEPAGLTVCHELRKRNGKVRFRKFNRDGAEHFNLAVYVTGDLSQLEAVTYELHPTFRSPVRTVTNPAGGFRLEIWTWGEFDIDVTFHFKDGRTASTTYSLEYSDELPEDPSEYRDETDPSILQAS